MIFQTLIVDVFLPLFLPQKNNVPSYSHTLTAATDPLGVCQWDSSVKSLVVKYIFCLSEQGKSNLHVTSSEDAECRRTKERLSNGSSRGSMSKSSRSIPRRHTLGGPRSSKEILGMQTSEMDRKREAFLEHLKQKYPHHATAIMGHQERLRDQVWTCCSFILQSSLFNELDGKQSDWQCKVVVFTTELFQISSEASKEDAVCWKGLTWMLSLLYQHTRDERPRVCTVPQKSVPMFNHKYISSANNNGVLLGWAEHGTTTVHPASTESRAQWMGGWVNEWKYIFRGKVLYRGVGLWWTPFP